MRVAPERNDLTPKPEKILPAEAKSPPRGKAHAKEKWEIARQARIFGRSYKEASKASGISESAIRKRASAEKWHMDAHEITESVQAWVADAASAWQEDITKLLQKLTLILTRIENPRTRAELKADVSMMKDLITAGRAHFRLDADQNQPRQQIAVICMDGVRPANPEEGVPVVSEVVAG